MAILPICHNEKISTVIECKQKRFDFWNSCKHLQSFVNIEALMVRIGDKSQDNPELLTDPLLGIATILLSG